MFRIKHGFFGKMFPIFSRQKPHIFGCGSMTMGFLVSDFPTFPVEPIAQHRSPSILLTVSFSASLNRSLSTSLHRVVKRNGGEIWDETWENLGFHRVHSLA